MVAAYFYLYPTEQSGNASAVRGPYRPLGFLRRDPSVGPNGDLAYGLFFELGDTPLNLGERRRTNLSFLVQESLDAFKEAKRFYVWDRRIVGEVTLVDDATLMFPLLPPT
jgi:hypothetical protein